MSKLILLFNSVCFVVPEELWTQITLVFLFVNLSQICVKVNMQQGGLSTVNLNLWGEWNHLEVRVFHLPKTLGFTSVVSRELSCESEELDSWRVDRITSGTMPWMNQTAASLSDGSRCVPVNGPFLDSFPTIFGFGNSICCDWGAPAAPALLIWGEFRMWVYL